MSDERTYEALGWFYLILALIGTVIKETTYVHFALGAAVFCMLGSIMEVMKDED